MFLATQSVFSLTHPKRIQSGAWLWQYSFSFNYLYSNPICCQLTIPKVHTPAKKFRHSSPFVVVVICCLFVALIFSDFFQFCFVCLSVFLFSVEIRQYVRCLTVNIKAWHYNNRNCRRNVQNVEVLEHICSKFLAYNNRLL